ncbi:permease, major facilitator superfamily [Waddlia chondrophila 2032/99]|uniref:Permease, major facilitator superfamily n=1 Tax=Waddlia chondrophila 2032/99 TaxID=765953 RepID=F8LAK7_9BACT|nr:permease, major facilitator superfamily [Waddlia chondrophila 2032/99]
MKTDLHHQRTRAAFMWSRILRTPFWAIYTMLPFILFRDLNASPFQIAVTVALKPMVSIFSMYWSAAVRQRRDLLVSNIIWAGVLGLLPFFFFPFVDSPWFFIASFGFFMLLHRGVIPAWMEILKLNIPNTSREKVFAWGSALGYLGDGILPFLFGALLDGYFQAWRWIFPLTALIGLIPILFQARILVRFEVAEQPKRIPFKQSLVQPWVSAWMLIKERSDFRSFQVGFMLGGAGLMIMHAVLPAFFMGVLQLSYKELAIALTLCKGIGFAATSQFWAKWMSKVDIYRFSSVVTLMAFLFPFCLLAAQMHLYWIYTAYIVYGVMQAGSELSWNLSGPIFSGDEDSSLYSSVNVVTVGLRGCIAPGLGSYLVTLMSSASVLLIGGGFCLLAFIFMASYSKTQRQAKIYSGIV